MTRAQLTAAVIGTLALTGKRPCSAFADPSRDKQLNRLHDAGLTCAKGFAGLTWGDVELYRWVDRSGRVLVACNLVFDFKKATWIGFKERFQHALTPENSDIPVSLMGVTQLFVWALRLRVFRVQVERLVLIPGYY